MLVCRALKQSMQFHILSSANLTIKGNTIDTEKTDMNISRLAFTPAMLNGSLDWKDRSRGNILLTDKKKCH